MAESIALENGLELLIVKSIDYAGDKRVMDIIRQCADPNPEVGLQIKVFIEQGVPLPKDRILAYEDSVGTPEEIGGLNEGLPHSHLYVLKMGEPVGMLVSSEIKVPDLRVPGSKGPSMGNAILEEFPPLVLQAEQQQLYPVRLSELDFPSDEISMRTIPEIMLMTQRHFIADPTTIMAIFNDGIGADVELLRRLGYWVCEIKVPVPTMNPQTIEDYGKIIDEVPIYGLFRAGVKPQLTKEGAYELLRRHYLKDCYISEDRPGRVQGQNLWVRDLECIVELERRIDTAIQDHRHVGFQPLKGLTLEAIPVPLWHFDNSAAQAKAEKD